MEFQFLETERLFLRLLTPEGLKYIFENLKDNEIKKELGRSNEEDFRKEKEKYEAGYTSYRRSVLNFQLMIKETKEIIGNCGFHNWYSDHRRAELGYELFANEFKRKGYMGEALKTVLYHGFHDLNLNRVEACIGPDNIASLALVQSFGFRKEGVLRQHYFYNEKLDDSIIFSLLSEEYFK